MIDARQRLRLPSGESMTYYSLPRLEQSGMANLSRLPVSLRIVLESVLRNRDGRRIRDEDVEALVSWQPDAARTAEVPLVVGRALRTPAHVRVIGVELDEEDRDLIRKKLGTTLGKFASPIERVTVRRSDANGRRDGVDHVGQRESGPQRIA